MDDMGDRDRNALMLDEKIHSTLNL